MPISARDKLVESATQELGTQGVFATSLDAIRRRAGVSTGSAYHHFPRGMVGVSAEVYRSTLLEYQEGAAEVLNHASSAQRSVGDAVVHLLTWIESHPARAQLLYQLENAVDPAVLAGAPQPLGDAIDAWIDRFGTATAGDDRAQLLALWTGPAKEYGRMWTRDRQLAPPTAMGEPFAHAAWHCVKPFVRTRRRAP